jgi:hypothetical protein
MLLLCVGGGDGGEGGDGNGGDRLTVKVPSCAAFTIVFLTGINSVVGFNHVLLPTS